MRLDVPQVFFEMILVVIGVALYKLSLNKDKAVNMLVVLSILVLIHGFGLTSNGNLRGRFFDFDNYDKVKEVTPWMPKKQRREKGSFLAMIYIFHLRRP